MPVLGYNYAVASSIQRDRGILIVLLVVPLLFSLVAAWVFDWPARMQSPVLMANLVGPTANGLLHGQGLTFCTQDMGTLGNPICFHAARMPIPSLVVALGERLFGDRFLPIALFKLLLLLVPLEGALFLVWRRLPRSGWLRYLVVFLLLMPFGMTPLLADVVNMQVEEGYLYSFLALAVAILFFAMKQESGRSAGVLRAVLFALSVDAIYLSKSAMAPAVLVLTIAYLLQERRSAVRVLVLLLVAMAPLGWALHQHHASGRYSLGTSLDGFNLRKGNNEAFLDRYPPAPGDSLDRYDPALNAGLHFPDEWSFNDVHQKAAINYLRMHPRRALQGDLRKVYVIFFTIHKLGSAETKGLTLKVETVGFIVFRLLLWTAIGFAIYGFLWPRKAVSGDRRCWATAGMIFLFLIAACALPYVLGFAYMRHVSILIYPSALMCCAVLVEEHDLDRKGTFS